MCTAGRHPPLPQSEMRDPDSRILQQVVALSLIVRPEHVARQTFRNSNEIPSSNSYSFIPTVGPKGQNSVTEESGVVRNEELHLLLVLLCISTSFWSLDPNMAAAALPVSLPLPVSQSKSRAELAWGRSEEYKESAALPVPNHHHDELELRGLTIPKNSSRRRETGKTIFLRFFLFFSGRRGEGWWTKWSVCLFVTEALSTQPVRCWLFKI
jgi:hypothetical protein